LNIGVVVPVYADYEALASLLRRIDEWGERGPSRVIVVNSQPDARVNNLVMHYGHTLLPGPPMRGAQLDIGARAMTADVIWFLHADAQPDADSIEAISRAIRAGAESGCFRFRFAGPRSSVSRLLEKLIAWRIRLGGIAYGDQGIFVRSDIYAKSDGFEHQALFEEVRLVRRLRRRKTFGVLPTEISVSPRRWERDGWIRRCVHNRFLAICYMAGVPAARLAAAYRKPSTSGAQLKS
jgi:rSAM/selenodomain-associated transferase 2